MKKLIVLLVIVGVVVLIAAFWADRVVHSDRGEMVGFAVGRVENGEQLIHIVVSMGMTRNSSAQSGGGTSIQDDWIAQTFFVRDAATGQSIHLSKTAHSALISDRLAANPECFIEGKLKPKTKYFLEFKPVPSEDSLYRHEFATRDDGLPFSRELLTLVPKR